MRRAGESLLFLAVATSLMGLGGCINPQESIVRVPTYPPLMNPQTALADSGSIYQQGTAMSLYETPRARRVGDLLTVRLDENMTTTNKATTDATRSSSISAKAADRATGAAMSLARLFNIGSADTTFTGKASITGNGNLQGTLAVSVISVLPSGNLMVAGDKIIATNNDNQRLRFSGVVNPVDIQPGNTVISSKIANARIEQQGVGVLNDSTTLGWLQRLFLSVTTF